MQIITTQRRTTHNKNVKNRKSPAPGKNGAQAVIEKTARSAQNLDALDQALASCKTLLILMHDFPDPDSLGSAYVLSYLVKQRYGIRCRITHGGLITRAENRAMVKQLRMKLTPADKIKWRRYKHIAMVDTQPAFGNHVLPKGVTPSLVFDHHATDEQARGSFVDVRTDYGTCVTILLEYLQAAELPLTADVATAIAYAIRSETQELGRDAGRADIRAYLEVYPKASMRKLFKISRPKLSHNYFMLLKTALKNARAFRHIAHVHLGEIASPEFVPLIADILLRHEGIGWSFATGRYQGALFISVRASHPKAHAGRLLAQTIGKYGSAGGHKAMAGGYIAVGRLNGTKQNGINWKNIEDRLANRLVRKLGYKIESGWKLLLEENGDEKEED